MNATSEILSVTVADLGNARITIGGLVLAATVIAVAIIASRLLTRLLAGLRLRRGGSAGLYILERLGNYGVIIVGVLFAFSSLGVNLSTLAVFAGALGVGVGLGLQGVVKEFVSGLVLLFDSIVAVGDFIELSADPIIRGEVVEIGARATRIRTNDNVDVLVPNSRLIEERFINWTLEGDTRRIRVPFSVAYGTDKSLVRDVVIAAAKSIPATLPDQGDRRTQVWLVGFGDSSLNFELVVWPKLEAVKRPGSMSAAYTWAIDDALRDANIEIPFPQRDIRVRSLFGHEGDEALLAVGQTPVARSAEPDEFAHGRNDAADDLLAKTPRDPIKPAPGRE